MSCSICFKSLCEELEAKFYEGTLNWENVRQHDAASILKLFVRELPHPLVTLEYLDAFLAVQSKLLILSVICTHDNKNGKQVHRLCMLYPYIIENFNVMYF